MSQYQHTETLGVRAGSMQTEFGENSEAIFLTSSFAFDSAAQAAARFGGQEAGNIYSRFTNPSVDMFQQKLAALEGAEACIATSSGMSAILLMCFSLLKAGESGQVLTLSTTCERPLALSPEDAQALLK